MQNQHSRLTEVQDEQIKPVHAAMCALQAEREALQKQLCTLEDGLSSVVQLEHNGDGNAPSRSKQGPEIPPSPRSSLAQRIDCETECLAGLNRRLASILGRLEV